MAAERDLELLDDYLANRLGTAERSAFEQKLNTDPDLKNEYQLQQEFVKGIKKARMAELKTMMNHIPVPAGPSGAAIGTKIALWTVVVGAIGSGIYFYLNQEKEAGKTLQTQAEQPAETPPANEPEEKPVQDHEKPPVVADEPSAAEHKPVESPKAIKEDKPVTKQPSTKINVFDPTKEAEENQPVTEDNGNTIAKQPDRRPSVAVTIDSDNKKYNFHYQFKEGKLILYGPFEANLYEIMEFFSDDGQRTMFLFYNEQYYLLKEDNDNLKPLTAIKDPALLKKLREYRN